MEGACPMGFITVSGRREVCLQNVTLRNPVVGKDNAMVSIVSCHNIRVQNCVLEGKWRNGTGIRVGQVSVRRGGGAGAGPRFALLSRGNVAPASAVGRQEAQICI